VMPIDRRMVRVTIERTTPTIDPSGAVPADEWEPIAAPLYATVRPLGGKEMWTAPQFVATEQLEFRLRWSRLVADVSPVDRLVIVGESDIYDIMGAHEVGRRRGLRILASRRAA